jgi:thioesterase domain-containing protein/acyl carrier protein
VQVEHRNVMSFFTALDMVLGREPGVVLAVTSVAFDPSIHDLFWTLARGYHVILWPGMDAGEGPTVAELIRAHHVTLMLGVPSFYRMILGLPGGREALESLRHLVTGGEPLPPELLEEVGDAVASRMINMYGPTETTVAATAWSVQPKTSHISIGRPLANTRLYLLDRHLRPVPLGATGELFIGGAGVTRGYLNRPELNAERFIASPFGLARERLYRTGDLARFLPDGNLDFVGRVDNQVKIRGFRIELGEIDAVLGRHPGVREAVVDVHRDGHRQPQLVAYIVPAAGATPTRKELREWVGRELPGYMVPALFVMQNKLPLATTGKVDRRALPPPTDADRATPEPSRTATATEATVSDFWHTALGRDHFGLEEDFFELGGNSLSAVQIMTAVQKRFGIELPLHTIFETPTIAGLATGVEKALWHKRPATSTRTKEAPASEWTPTQRQLLAIWERLLPVRPIGLRDSFLELQGPLMLVDAMLAEVRNGWGVYAEGLPIATFLEDPTIEALARTLEGARDATGTLAVCLQPRGDKPPLFLIHAGGGYVFFYRALAARLGRERPVFAIRAESEADGRGRPFHLSESIQQVAARYLAEIKSVQPHGPYRLGGACIGGIVAYEMARQLEAQGETVAGPVLLFDSFVINNPHISKAEELQILRAAGIKPPETPAEARRRRIQRHLAQARKAGLVRGLAYLAGRAVRHAPALCVKGVRAVFRRLRRPTPAALPAPAPVATSTHPEDSLTQLQRKLMEEFMEASKRLQSAYVPGDYSGRLVLFEAEESPDPRRLWTGLARGGLVVHGTPGTHLDMMEEPAVINTAALVNQHLTGVNGTSVPQANAQPSPAAKR